MIEDIVVDNFSPVVGRILVRIDDAGQGGRFKVFRHLKPIAGLEKLLLGEMGRWVDLGDGEGVVLEEGVTGQRMGLRSGLREAC